VHLDDRRAREADHLVVARPARCRDQHLVTGAEEHHAGVVERLLRAVRDDDVGRGDPPVALVVRVRVERDRLAEREDALDRRVARRALVECRLGGVPDRLRGVEVGLPRPEVDHLASGGLEGAGALRDRDRRGFAEVRDVRRGVERERSGHGESSSRTRGWGLAAMEKRGGDRGATIFRRS
jgi:hypothetical protein